MIWLKLAAGPAVSLLELHTKKIINFIEFTVLDLSRAAIIGKLKG